MLEEKVAIAKKVLTNFKNDVKKYTKENKLSILPPYNELRDKDAIGIIYRADQVYYETLNDFRTKYNGVIAILTNYKVDNTNRVLTRQIEGLITIANAEVETLKNMIFTAKDRLKFYQNIMYLISNMSFGDF